MLISLLFSFQVEVVHDCQEKRSSAQSSSLGNDNSLDILKKYLLFINIHPYIHLPVGGSDSVFKANVLRILSSQNGVLLDVMKSTLEKVSEVLDLGLANLYSVYVTWKLTRSFQNLGLLFYERGESEWVSVSKTTKDYVDIQCGFIGANKNHCFVHFYIIMLVFHTYEYSHFKLYITDFWVSNQ